MTATAAALGHRMAVGSAWVVALRWCVRLIGLASTLVLVRLLSPDDFGIVAMAMLLVGFLEVFNETGQTLALIRHPNPTRAHYDSAWTIGMLLGCGLAGLILLAAPFSTAYFGEPRAVPVMQVLALRAVIGGFENIGIVEFRKHLDFARDFRFNVAQKLLTTLVTLAAALVLRNYWALVIGIVTGRLIGTILSYTMHPYRPRWSLAKVGELWAFSWWTLCVHVGAFANSKLDELAVGGIAGTPEMGRYSVGLDLATTPVNELVIPLSRTMFPVMAKTLDDLPRLTGLWLDILGWIAVMSSYTAVMVAATAPDLVAVVLGPKWLGAIPLMPWLALAGGVYGLTNNVFTTCTVLGEARISARLTWSRIAISAVALVFAARFGTIVTIAVARCSVNLVMAPALFLVLSRFLPVTPVAMLARLWRPLLACPALAAAALAAESALSGQPPLLRLAAAGSAGTLAYGAAMAATWLAAGRPPGVEATAWRLLRQQLARAH